MSLYFSLFPSIEKVLAIKYNEQKTTGIKQMSGHYLKNQYPAVERAGVLSYGGNQTWSENPVIRKCGCGVIGSLDLLLYLGRYHCAAPWLPTEGPVAQKEYDRLCAALSRKYFPLLPPFGTNGVALACGLNGIFRKTHMPFHASWRISEKRLFGTVEAMLDKDIPAVISIGANFPLVWQGEGVTLYTKDRTGAMRKAASARAHYVTVTGSDDEWLRISSWGREYYMNKAEYKRYIEKNSSSIISNVLYVERT